MNAGKPKGPMETVLNQDSMKVVENPMEVELPNSFSNLSRNLYLGMKNVKINQILKSLMLDHKITLKGLSKATGIPLSTLGSYTAGKKAAYNPDHLAKICHHFNISADYLLFGAETDLGSVNSLPTEEVFTGWLKVKIERAIPIKNKSEKKG
jgi:transcriptional regulator with XRE-family HTH domain